MQDALPYEESPDILVVGAGPAGLAAAEVASATGLSVWVVDQKPSFGRKFLMAGKSGLNLTKAEPVARLIKAVEPPAGQIESALRAFDASAVQAWAEALGVPVFTGSSGRVFPKVMKASPLLRALLMRLEKQNVRMFNRWRWDGGLQNGLRFETPEGAVLVHPKATVFALGGASWARLGSDGKWSAHLPSTPFKPSNMGFEVNWSPFMKAHFGSAIKNVRLCVGDKSWRGEFVISPIGVEGGGIYEASTALREKMRESGAVLTLDLFPDIAQSKIEDRLSALRGKMSGASFLRKTLKLTGARAALVREIMGQAMPLNAALAPHLKALPLHLTKPMPIDQAISTAGGVPLVELDDTLMFRNHPGFFAAGEMLDWEAPTGGYLITTCLATGRLAGQSAALWVSANSDS